jgi:RNA polymerase sigma-70 factor, ECF subfamily
LIDLPAVSAPSHPGSPIDPELLAIDSLIEQVRAGDERAFARLVARMQPRVSRWVIAYVSSADEADDVVQETFVLALKRLAQYRGGGMFQSWLYRIASRAAGRTRAKARHRAALASGAKAWPDRIVYETDPGGRVDRERLAALVREFWEDLPARQRTVVDLVDLQGYSPAEAATMLDLNASTLRANLFKGRQTLRSRLLARHPSLGFGTGKVAQ